MTAQQHATGAPASTPAASASVAVEIDGFVELEAGQDLRQSSLYNDDLAPTRISQRTWGKQHIAALWVGMAVCVPTYTLGGVLTAYFGLSVAEALITILLANIIVLLPLILNAFPGTRYGIPFPVLLRSSFGLYGSNLPALIRALVACGWFGIQTLFGGVAVHLLISSIFPAWRSAGSFGEVIGFFMFWLINISIVMKGSNAIKYLETWSAPLLLLVGVALLAWAWPQVDIREILSTPATRPPEASAAPYLLSGLTAMVGFWATLSLNIPDFSRYARSQKDQIIGQLLGLPLTMFLFASLGVILTAASATLVGETIADPVNLIGRIDNPLLVIIAMAIIILATLSTNIAADIVSPTNDFQNIAPSLINEQRGVLLTGIVGIVIVGWELLKKLHLIESDIDLEVLYPNWLLGYSSLLGPIAGIMIVDYFVINRQRLDLVSLYRRGGSVADFNWCGLAAFLVPVTLTLITLLTGRWRWFYDYGWFTGSISGAVLYYLLNRALNRSFDNRDGQTA